MTKTEVLHGKNSAAGSRLAMVSVSPRGPSFDQVRYIVDPFRDVTFGDFAATGMLGTGSVSGNGEDNRMTAKDLWYKPKLIEVALPLEDINRESAREKSIRHGHPSTLHLWWARRPLAACRAVLFAQLVDDPSAHPDKFPTEEEQEAERNVCMASSLGWSSGRTSTTRNCSARRTRRSSSRPAATRRRSLTRSPAAGRSRLRRSALGWKHTRRT